MNLQSNDRSKNVLIMEEEIPLEENTLMNLSSASSKQVNDSGGLFNFLPQDLIYYLNMEESLIETQQNNALLEQLYQQKDKKGSSDYATKISRNQPCTKNIQELRDELRQRNDMDRILLKHRSAEPNLEERIIGGVTYKTKIPSSDDIPEVNQGIPNYYQKGWSRFHQCSGNQRQFIQENSTSAGPRYVMMQSCYPSMGIQSGRSQDIHSRIMSYPERQFLHFNRAVPTMQMNYPNFSNLPTAGASHPHRSCKLSHQGKMQEQIGFPVLQYQDVKKALSYNQPKANLTDDPLNESQLEINFTEVRNMTNENLVSVIKSHHGSMMLQKILDMLSSEEVQLLIEKIIGSIKEIMCDHYGNYVTQKLFQCCTASQRIFIVNNVKDSFVEIATSTSGTHSIQSLIENCKEEEEIKFLNACIENHIMQLSCNSNATHIIQKIIAKFEEKKREFLNVFILENLKKMCMNANGLCVVRIYFNLSIQGEEIYLRESRSLHLSKSDLDP